MASNRSLFVDDLLICADDRVFVIAAHAPDGNMIGVAGRHPSASKPWKISSVRLFTPMGETVQQGIDKAVVKHIVAA